MVLALALLVSLAPPGAQARTPVAVLTQHNNAARTGANLSETILTTSNVSVHQFGKLFARQVDGDVYAQPLYVPNLVIPGKGRHNVVFLATMHNSVYAFDADDPAAAAPLWKVSLGTPVPIGDVGGRRYRDIANEVGVVSTPVIDVTTRTIYVVAATRDGGGPYAYRHRLHALNLLTGAEKLGGPAIVQGAVPGSGVGSRNGTVAFDSRQQLQRTGLLLVNGAVYFAFASYGDDDPYHGWVFGYSVATLRRTAIFNTTPNGGGPGDPQRGEGGIWQSGQGISADTRGDLYLGVANGTFTAHKGGRDYGNSFLKLRPTAGGLTVVDWFTPYNQASLSGKVDIDIGSIGVLLIPGTNLLLGGGKQGKLYLLDRSNLGHHRTTDDGQIVQSFDVNSTHLHGSPVFWNGPAGPLMYIWAEKDALKAYRLRGAKFQTKPAAVGSVTLTCGAGRRAKGDPCMPGGILSLSANGRASGSGIIWATTAVGDANQAVRPGILRAFDAANARELWNSEQNRGRDKVGNFAKFCSPTIAEGKVYLATFSKELVVYGLLQHNRRPAGRPDAARR